MSRTLALRIPNVRIDVIDGAGTIHSIHAPAQWSSMTLAEMAPESIGWPSPFVVVYVAKP